MNTKIYNKAKIIKGSEGVGRMELYATWQNRTVVFINIIYNKANFNRIEKRYMFNGTKNTLSKMLKSVFSKNNHVIPETPKQDMATWVIVERIKPAQKTKPHPGPKQITSDGKTELRDIDHSGHNHPMVANLDSAKNSKDLDVHGILTRSKSPYEGVTPEKISETTLDHQKKPQYVHNKEETYIEKNAVAVDVIATVEFQEREDFVKYTNRLKIEKNID